MNGNTSTNTIIKAVMNIDNFIKELEEGRIELMMKEFHWNNKLGNGRKKRRTIGLGTKEVKRNMARKSPKEEGVSNT